MKLNNKGFTLIEVLAVVVILSMIMVIMIPSVENIMEKNRQNNYQDLKNSILQAAKVYMSDFRYDIKVKKNCTSDNEIIEVISVNGLSLTNSKFPIRVLVAEGYLKTDKDGNISDPRNKNKVLNLIEDDPNESFATIKYQCSKKDYIYELTDSDLKWKEK